MIISFLKTIFSLRVKLSPISVYASFPSPHKWAAFKGKYTPIKGIDWSRVICMECGEKTSIGVWKFRPCRARNTKILFCFGKN